jgi:thioredoxin 1
VIAYSHGQAIDRFHSAQTEAFLRRFLNQLIALHAANGKVDMPKSDA